jgi:F-type H+-transporting ATPase subunit epsilon
MPDPERTIGVGHRTTVNRQQTFLMRVEIITPDKALFKGEATSVVVPGVDGSMGFLNNHAPLITVLKAGDVKVKTSSGEESFTVKGGVVEVMNNMVLVLAE